MADKKLVAEITSMDEDFTQWYTDVCIKADLIAYSHIKKAVKYIVKKLQETKAIV